MLDIRLEILLAHQLSCAMLCLGLRRLQWGWGRTAGLARALAVKHRRRLWRNPHLGDQLPFYIVAIVMLTAMPYHFRLDAGAHLQR